MPGEPDGDETKREAEPVTRGEDVERLLAWSLRLAYVPVVVLLLAGLGAFVYGTALFVHSVGHIVEHSFPVRHQIVLFLACTYPFFVGATLLISAVGFYELFIREIHLDGPPRIPAWLEMRDLNDLKARVIAMIVLVLSVSFVELAVDEGSGLRVLELGGGIAV